MPRRLADAVGEDAQSGAPPSKGERVHWLECFTSTERVTDFCEATDPEGNFESNSSAGYKEYQDRLRSVALAKEGKEKSEIATLLGRSSKFVQTWWKKEPKEVPRPQGVHEYLKPDFWRDIEIVRGFGKGLGIYDEIMPIADWQQAMADGAAFSGGYRLKYDKEGRMRPQGNQNAKDGLLPGKFPKLDKLAQKLMVTQSIDDRVLKRPGILWYPDGSADAIEHRHEAWTALMSFGAPRILTIDKQPVLLRDGDLIVFGTQRHGVPKMHMEGGTFDEYGGRISVVFFFMPTGQQAQGAEPWKALTDEPSRKASAMLHDAHLGSAAQVQGLQTGAKAQDVAQLVELGFSPEEASAALQATGFNVEAALEVLLGGGGPALLSDSSVGGGSALSCCRSSQIVALYARLESLRKQNDLEVVDGDSDEMLAQRLQREEEGPEDGEEIAILQQLQELENQEASAVDMDALRNQFAAYDDMLDAKDADEWDGRGDLMVREWRRAHLQIEQQDSSNIYAFGCGSCSEQVFFELLSLHSIRVLYDFRADPDAVALKHFSVRALELGCKARGITFRHIALGRETAYGILKHLREDEGRNSLAELVWHARRKRTAMLGAEEDWRSDHRLAIASRLRDAGHSVLHVMRDGSIEEHPESIEVPDFLASEESKLRLLEKQRLAGEHRKAPKSAVSRSTEVVAQRLTNPPKEIDAAEEIRKANTQAELCRAQRRLASLQRRIEDSSDAQAGLGPKLLNVSKYVKAEAAQQRENLAAGKTKDGKDKNAKPNAGSIPSYSWAGSGGTSGGNPTFDAGASSSQASMPAACSSHVQETSDDFVVECRGCAAVHPWNVLEPGDGHCPQCAAKNHVQQPSISEMVDEHAPGERAPLDDIATFQPTAVENCSPAPACDKSNESDKTKSGSKSSWRARRFQQRLAEDA